MKFATTYERKPLSWVDKLSSFFDRNMFRAVFPLVIVASITVAAQLPWTTRLDVSRALQDPNALEHIRVSYFVRNQQLYVYGTGKVILQSLERGMDLVPTCHGSVPQTEVQQLLRTFVDRHFFDLPERQFLFVYASSGGPEDLELHTIQIQDGQAATSRTFGIGKYMEKEEKIPDDFTAVERELLKIKQSAIASDRPCRLAAPQHINR